MNHTKYGIEFFSVPKPHKYVDIPDDLLCEECNDVIEHPIQVYTCKHRLCAPCWQKSAYNLWGNKNECLKCKTPTELICYRDFWRFVGRNLFERNLILDQGNCIKLEALEMYCNIDGCPYKGQRWEVLMHERKCWREQRNRQLEDERREAAVSVKKEEVVVVDKADMTPPPQTQAETKDEAEKRNIVTFQIPSTPRKQIRRK